MRHEHPERAIVEGGKKFGRRPIRDAHDARDIRCMGGQKGEIGCASVEGRMLLIDDDKVHADATKDFGRMACRRLDESPDPRFPGQQPAPENGSRGTCGDDGHDDEHSSLRR